MATSWKGCSLACPPRYGTPRRPDRATIGHEVETWHLLLTGHRFMPWQRYVADVAGELDDAGRLVYDTVVLSVPRQSGKTSLNEARSTWSTRRGRDRTAVYAAQSRLMARARLLDEYEGKRLARCPALAGRYVARRSNGSEAITWLDAKALGSKLTIVASTDDAGHGFTVDEATIDEAGLHPDLTLVTALDPTMITRPDPQLWITGTVGDGTDGLLLHYEEVGEASLTDPDTRVAVFVWGAGPDDERGDPAVWRAVSPALGHTQTIERLAARSRTQPADVFDRGYLNRRPLTAAAAKIPADAWAETGMPADDVDLDRPVVLAVAVSLDRSASTIAVAGPLRADPARLGVVIDRRSRTDWVAPALAELNAAHRPAAVYADRRLGAGGIIDEAKARGVPVEEVTPTVLVDACATFLDLVLHRRLAHPRDAVLDAAAAHAVDRPLGDAWAWSMRASMVDVSPIIAATHAAAGHRRLFPVDDGPPRIR